MTLFVASIVVALLASAFAIWPLVRREFAAIDDVMPGELLDVEARKRVTLAALRDIEYDRIGGKLDEEDYRAVRARLEREALEALQAAETVSTEPAASDDVAAGAPAGVAVHACGFENPAGSRFCSGCGQPLA